MRALSLFVLAALFEIGGGYLVWIWLRNHRSLWLGLAGFAALAIYGVVPVFQSDVYPFGRIYAAYGAVFIVLSLLWGWQIDQQRPDSRDMIGAMICVAGAVVMMWPRVGG